MPCTYESSCCPDCLFFLANGDTPAELTESEAEQWLDSWTERNEGIDWSLADWSAPTTYVYDDDRDEVSALLALAFAGEVDPSAYVFDLDGVELTAWTETDRYYGTPDEGSFSWSSCTLCGSNLGGDRYPVAGWVAANA